MFIEVLSGIGVVYLELVATSVGWVSEDLVETEFSCG